VQLGCSHGRLQHFATNVQHFLKKNKIKGFCNNLITPTYNLWSNKAKKAIKQKPAVGIADWEQLLI
jgi:hypothetical protein